MPSLEVGSGPLFCLGRCTAVSEDTALSIPEHGSRSSIDWIQDILSPILWTLGLDVYKRQDLSSGLVLQMGTS